MELINTVLGIPLGFVIYFANRVFGDYGLAIVAFAALVRIPLFPIMLFAHRNSIRLLRLQPSLRIIKQMHAGDRDGLYEAQNELFAREKYKPLVGFVPLVAQLLMLMGMLQVLYHPLQHVLRLEPEVIGALVDALCGISGASGGFAQQISVLEAFQRPENWAAFRVALAGFQDGEEIFRLIQSVELRFLGLNLATTPSLARPSPELAIVLLSGVTALLFCFAQNAVSPGALSQSRGTNIGLTVFTVALSMYFAFALPVGVGLYWTAGNLAAIGVVLLLDLLCPPKKLAAEALAHLRAAHKTKEQLREDRLLKKKLRKREKDDAARFASEKKRLVFYALSSGQYKYYKAIIDYLVECPGITIHYLTNDPNDALFSQRHPCVQPYYASQRKTISLMLKLDADILVTTVTDLQSYHMKRSIARDDIEYINLPHGLTSLHFAARENAYDNFDTIFCVGPHQVAEVRRREELASLPKKQLVKAGYGLHDQLVEAYAALPDSSREKPKILIAPSWQKDNILDICIDSLLEALLNRGYAITVRPHPQYVTVCPERIEALAKRYSKHASDGEIIFELDFSGNDSIFQSDLLITDWSGIAHEFSYCTLKPSVFINTPPKMMNPNYGQYGLEALCLSLRGKIGVAIDLGDIGTLDSVVAKLLGDKKAYAAQIEEIVRQYLYHPGRNGEAGGKYILQRLGQRAGNAHEKS